MKTFEEYNREEIIRKDSPDVERAKSMINESERKIRSMMLNLENRDN